MMTSGSSLWDLGRKRSIGHSYGKKASMSTEELVPRKEDRIVCVKVGKIERENLYEMTRKFWKVRLERASRATHVLAVVDGAVKAVYTPNKWYYTKDPKHAGRCEFVGELNLDNDYIGKSVTGLYGRSANPVKYINL